MTRRRKKIATDKLRLRLTTAGLLYLLVAVLIGVAAIKGRAPMMLVLFSIMITSLIASAILAKRMVSKLRLRRDMPKRAWQNQAVYLGYYLRNLRRRGSSIALALTEDSPEGIHSISGYCVHLPAMRNFRSVTKLLPRRRGRIRLRQVDISTVFPFGLVQATRKIRQTSSMVVWPARGRLKRQLLHRGAVETSQAAPSPASGGQDEFFGLREYRPGDNPRWIHWKRSAIRNVPVIREMAKPLPEELWIIVDTYWEDLSDIGFACREKMLRLAATLVDHAFSQGYQIGLVLEEDGKTRTIPAGNERGHRTACLDALAAVGNNTRRKLDRTLGQINRNTFRHAQVIALSPQPESLPGNMLGMLRGRCRHLTVITRKQLDTVFEDAPIRTEDQLCR